MTLTNMRIAKINSGSGLLTANVFENSSATRTLVIASATGVRQSYYRKFAEYIASKGINVITFDYLGIGDSLTQPIKQLSNNTEDWARKDLESIINYVVGLYPNDKLSLLGHSIGGQLIGLAPSSLKADKIVLVAAQSGYWKLWRGFGRARLWFNWHILIPALTGMFGYLPSKRITAMENLPKNVARQWSRWGRKRDYLLSEISITSTYFNKITAPLIAYSIEDDKLGAKEAVDWITGQYINALAKSVHLSPSHFGVDRIGHFGIFKERFRDSLWPMLLHEIGKNDISIQ